MRQATSSAASPVRSGVVSALLVGLAVAAAGYVTLCGLPPSIAFDIHRLSHSATFCLPVDALAVAQHDIAYGDEHHAFLARLQETGVKLVWQNNYFSRRIFASGALDVDADGAEELCLQANDSTAAYAWALDAEGREVARLGPLRGTSARPGVPWDGGFAVEGAFQLAGRRVVLCRLNSGYSLRPRGITLFDLATGTRLWTYDFAPNARRAYVVDIDSDEAPEILVTTGSPGNGLVSNGTDDSHAYVFVLDTDGTLRWRLRAGGVFGRTDAIVLPPRTRHAPPRTVVTFRSEHGREPEPGRIFLVDGRTGDVLDRHEFHAGIGAPYALGLTEAFVVGSEDGVLRRFDNGLELTRMRRFDGPVEVYGCADVDEDGNSEIVAATTRELLLLEDDLHTRARFPLDSGSLPHVALGSAGMGRLRLAILDGQQALAADLVPRPMNRSAAPVASVLVLGLVAGLATPFVRRARRARPLPFGLTAREFLLDYHQIRHETFERERPFARLRLWAQAHAAALPLPEGALETACDEFEHVGQASLGRFADRAAALRVERARVVRIRRGTREVAEALVAARSGPVADRPARVARALERIDALAAECYAAYWDVVMREPCRANAAVAMALTSKSQRLERAGVRTRTSVDPSGREPVLFDAGELGSVLAEIVENSLRALEGVRDPMIDAVVSQHPADPRRIVITVTDNGPGIPPEMRERVFSPDESARPAGGFGLYRARDVVRRWLGDLVLEDGPGGRGLCVKVVVRACRVLDTPPEAPTAGAGRGAS
jgi:signal transduction histidine kinase/outer membrane protein assembly factor BamB